MKEINDALVFWIPEYRLGILDSYKEIVEKIFLVPYEE